MTTQRAIRKLWHAALHIPIIFTQLEATISSQLLFFTLDFSDVNYSGVFSTFEWLLEQGLRDTNLNLRCSLVS